MRRSLPLLAAAALALGACSSGTSDDALTETADGEQTEASAVGSESDPIENGAVTDEPDTRDEAAIDPPSEAETESDDGGDASASAEELFPDVIDATATQSEDGTWTIAATLSSPYDTPERYADAWQVLGPDGTQYGERFLTHDHANEQPFTRSESGIEIPDDVDVVTIQGRDQVSGWGGETFELTLER